MHSLTFTYELPICPLFCCGVQESGVPGQRHRYSPAIAQLYCQGVVCDLHPDGIWNLDLSLPPTIARTWACLFNPLVLSHDYVLGFHDTQYLLSWRLYASRLFRQPRPHCYSLPPSGTERFRQILRASRSWISECRGTASTAPVVGFHHKE